jgi:hypothetical protein
MGAGPCASAGVLNIIRGVPLVEVGKSCVYTAVGPSPQLIKSKSQIRNLQSLNLDPIQKKQLHEMP